MKKTFSTLLMLAIASSVVLAGGDPNPSESSKMAVMKSGDVVKVFYKKSSDAKVKITILDQDNKAVFAEEVKNHSGFIRPYNLSQLPEGDYKIVMEDESDKREESISTVKDHSSALASVLKANEHQFVVTLYSKQEKSVKVSFLDSEENVLFAENYLVEGRMPKLFNLKNINGAVTIEVTDDTGIIKSTIVQE